MTHRPRHGSSRQRPSLLGRYPAPALHLVGTPRPPDPASALNWAPGPPPPQHGLDYAFARWAGQHAVRWRPGTDVTVRLAAGGPAGWDDPLAGLLAELAALTGLGLRLGEPAEPAAALADVPAGEIRVQHDRFGGGTGWPAPCAEHAGLGGAEPGADRRFYVRGIAVVNSAVTGAAPAPMALAVLRHQLGHALGLGHPVRTDQLMHGSFGGMRTGYADGDRLGLILLGRPAGPPDPLPHGRTPGGTPRCAT